MLDQGTGFRGAPSTGGGLSVAPVLMMAARAKAPAAPDPASLKSEIITFFKNISFLQM